MSRAVPNKSFLAEAAGLSSSSRYLPLLCSHHYQEDDSRQQDDVSDRDYSNPPNPELRIHPTCLLFALEKRAVK
jgi:hypothetical protein